MAGRRRGQERRTPESAQHDRLRHRRQWRALVWILASAVAIALIVGVGLVTLAGLNQARRASAPATDRSSTPSRGIGTIKGGVNILIAASDTRTGQGSGWGSTNQSAGLGRNDATLLFHLSNDHTRATVVSFPRDLMIPLPACPIAGGGTRAAVAKGQFNSTLNTGGLPCTVLTVEHLTGIESIPYAGVITFTGVAAMSDAIGGVPVCIAGKGIHDPHTGLNLAPGTVTLQGRQATQFLRTRHGVVDGSDLARISNQMVYFSALARTAASERTLANPLKVYGLARAAASNMRLSDRLDNIKTLSQIAAAMKNLDMNDVTFVQYPVIADPQNPGRVVPDRAAASTLFDAIRHDRAVVITGGTGRGSLVQASATPPSPTTPSGGGATSTPQPGSSPVELPKSIRGQTAATRTCSNGAG